jgi:hypothetical protein
MLIHWLSAYVYGLAHQRTYGFSDEVNKQAFNLVLEVWRHQIYPPPSIEVDRTKILPDFLALVRSTGRMRKESVR